MEINDKNNESTERKKEKIKEIYDTMCNKREKRVPKTGIYKITNKINGQAYIGQAVDIEKRWQRHINDSKNPNSHSYEYPICRAFRKYDVKNFDFVILEECERELLNEKEVAYIALFNTFFNGYNQTLGGDHHIIVPKENIIGIFNDLENTQLKHGVIAKNRNVSIETVDGINTGRYWHQDGRKYPIQKYIPQKRKINNCPLCGKEIDRKAKYCRMCRLKEKAKTVQPTKNNTKTKTSCELKNVSTHRVTERPNKNELEYEILRNSMCQVAEKFGVTDNAVRKWCRAYELPCKKDDIMARRKELGIEEYNTNITNDVGKRPVMKCDKNGDLIKIYDSATDAGRIIAGSGEYRGNERTIISKIRECCHGRKKTAYGYIWKFAE